MLTVTLSARSIGCSFSKVNAGQYYFALAFYVSYIFSTPEKVWNALIDPELTKQYWVNHRNVSDWKAGSRWQHQDYNDASIVRIAGKVVESSPPHRLRQDITEVGSGLMRRRGLQTFPSYEVGARRSHRSFHKDF